MYSMIPTNSVEIFYYQNIICEFEVMQNMITVCGKNTIDPTKSIKYIVE